MQPNFELKFLKIVSYFLKVMEVYFVTGFVKFNFRALSSGIIEDPDCVQAFLASLSNRLYQAEISDR